MTLNINRENVLDALMVAWLLFMAAFTYIGVIHLETISKCLLIQTEIMVQSSSHPPSIVLPLPPVNPQEPEDKETIA